MIYELRDSFRSEFRLAMALNGFSIWGRREGCVLLRNSAIPFAHSAGGRQNRTHTIKCDACRSDGRWKVVGRLLALRDETGSGQAPVPGSASIHSHDWGLARLVENLGPDSVFSVPSKGTSLLSNSLKMDHRRLYCHRDFLGQH